MSDPDRIPDEEFVVRCGVPPFTGNPLFEACDYDDGKYGFSVKAEIGLTVEMLAAECSNKCVGYTTAEKIRKMGYEVIRTGGSVYHATVVVPESWSQSDAEELAKLFQAARNPSPKKRRR